MAQQASGLAAGWLETELKGAGGGPPAPEPEGVGAAPEQHWDIQLHLWCQITQYSALWAMLWRSGKPTNRRQAAVDAIGTPKPQHSRCQNFHTSAVVKLPAAIGHAKATIFLAQSRGA